MAELVEAVPARVLGVYAHPDDPEFGALAYPDFVLTSTHAGGRVPSPTASTATPGTDSGRSK